MLPMMANEFCTWDERSKRAGPCIILNVKREDVPMVLLVHILRRNLLACMLSFLVRAVNINIRSQVSKQYNK